jgi:hypothetical protein
MPKKFILYISCAVILLAACASSPQTAGTKVPATGKPATPTAQSIQPTRPPGCTVKTRQPTPGPTEQSILPPPGEKDWSRGPTGAYITLIEYGDFM